MEILIKFLTYRGEVQFKKFLEGGKEFVIRKVHVKFREDINPRQAPQMILKVLNVSG
jgi:hypothetical protein